MTIISDATRSYRCRVVNKELSGIPNLRSEVFPDGTAVYTAEKNSRFYLIVFCGTSMCPNQKMSGYYPSEKDRQKIVEKIRKSRCPEEKQDEIDPPAFEWAS